MAFVAIDVVEVSRRSNGWFRRLCEAYVVEQLRHAKTEMRQLNHLRAIPTEDDDSSCLRCRRSLLRRPPGFTRLEGMWSG
jgi:hypothetical protein